MSVARPAGLAERWRALSPASRAVTCVLVAIVSVNVLLAGVQRLTGGPGPGGKPSSSYATAPDGAAAYAELLSRHGHPVRRLRSTLDEVTLDTAVTIVVLDPEELEAEESDALERFVRDGGRLVAAGRETAPTLRRLVGDGVVWSPRGVEQASPLAPAAEVAAVRSVRAGSEGSWAAVGAALPVLGHGEQVLAAVAGVGRGRVVLLGDASVVNNRLLDEDDNAAFGIAAVGPRARPVAFAEASHGYADGEGLGALPLRWRWVLAGVALAVLVWMWSRAKRFGPAEDATRALPPPRRAYVDAVAATLARTRQPEAALEPLRTVARAALARRAGLPAEADDSELVEAARRLGGPADDVARLLVPSRVKDDEALVGAGRAAAWVREMETGR